MQLLVRFSLILLIIFFFVSCNLIIGNPSSRVNPNDPEAQVTDFYAFPVADDTVLTTWQWNDWYNGSDEERIEEIRILHSNTNYPQVLLPFAGESFTNSSISQFEWKDLKKDTTHYFALHMKDERNRWYAPLYAKATLPGTVKSSVFGFIKSLQVDDVGSIINTSAGILVQNDAAPNSILVIELDVPDGIYVVSANIETFVTSGGITTSFPLRVFPVSRYWDEDPASGNGYWQLTNNSQDDYAVDDSVSAFIDSTEPTTNDVTEVIRKSLSYNPKQIVFKIDGTGSSNVNVFNNTFINIEYYTN